MSQDTKTTGVKRREFLKVLGASSAALAAAACSEPTGKLIPYLVSPDETVPGVSTYYATTCRECSAGCGVIAETRDGRVDQARGKSGSSAEPRRALRARSGVASGSVQPRSLPRPDGQGGRRVEGDHVGRRDQPPRDRRSRGRAARQGDAVFLNQHESGSFPRFLDTWLAGVRHAAASERRLRGRCGGDRSEPPRRTASRGRR